VSQHYAKSLLRLITTLFLVGALGQTGTSSAQETTPKATESPATILANAQNAFRYQDYAKTLELVRPLLYPAVLLSTPKEIEKAREYLASSYWWLKEKDKAREEFTALLLEDSEHRLDPFYYPAPLVSFFETLREELHAKGILDQKIIITTPTPVVMATAPPPWTTRFLPFGMPQFGADRDIRGWLFLSGQGLSLATSIVSALWIEYGLREGDGFFSSENVETARALKTTWLTSTLIFAGLYTVGVVDAFMAPSLKPSSTESLSQR
jgi:hypothetical protein